MLYTGILYCTIMSGYRKLDHKCQSNIPLLFIIVLYVRYLNDEDDDVSMAFIPFAVGYVGVLKVCANIMLMLC